MAWFIMSFFFPSPPQPFELLGRPYLPKVKNSAEKPAKTPKGGKTPKGKAKAKAKS